MDIHDTLRINAMFLFVSVLVSREKGCESNFPLAVVTRDGRRLNA